MFGMGWGMPYGYGVRLLSCLPCGCSSPSASGWGNLQLLRAWPQAEGAFDPSSEPSAAKTTEPAFPRCVELLSSPTVPSDGPGHDRRPCLRQLRSQHLHHPWLRCDSRGAPCFSFPFQSPYQCGGQFTSLSGGSSSGRLLPLVLAGACLEQSEPLLAESRQRRCLARAHRPASR